MINTCHAAGIKVYADAVINHMAMMDYGRQNWQNTANFPQTSPPPANLGIMQGINLTKPNVWYDGWQYSAMSFNFPLLLPASYGGPYYGEQKRDPNNSNVYLTAHFHVNPGANAGEPCYGFSYASAWQVQNCGLDGLPDWDHAQQWVRDRNRDYLNDLVSVGVDGFRIDAAKHINPVDLKTILNAVNNTVAYTTAAGVSVPAGRPHVFAEVINWGGEPVTTKAYWNNNGATTCYTGTGGSATALLCERDIGNVTEFKYGEHVAKRFRNLGGLKLKDLNNFETSTGMATATPTDKAVVFIDNHDTQRGENYPHMTAEVVPSGQSANPLYSHVVGQTVYRLANVFMLGYPYGNPQVMSSYDWVRSYSDNAGVRTDANGWFGPPRTSSTATQTENVWLLGNSRCGTAISGTQSNAASKWVCEHRMLDVANMVNFRKQTDGQALANWYDNAANRIAFSRGGTSTSATAKGFLAINGETTSWAMSAFYTAMPAGNYCNVITSNKNAAGNACVNATGGSVAAITVDSLGKITTTLATQTAIALHAGEKLGTAKTLKKSYTNMYYRGDTNSWGNTAMTLVDDYTWRIDVSVTAAGKVFKIDASGSWAAGQNWGDNATVDNIGDAAGANISIPYTTSGTYRIEFDDISKRYTVKKI